MFCLKLSENFFERNKASVTNLKYLTNFVVKKQIFSDCYICLCENDEKSISPCKCIGIFFNNDLKLYKTLFILKLDSI